jgi:glucan 1,3-beta-glucosidase
MKSFYCYFSLLATLTGAAPHPYADVRATGYWYESITHNGVSPTLSNTTYVIFRNVKDFGAKGDGTTDDTAAIQRAINDGGRNGNLGTTTAPAVIYFPLGTYVVSRSIQNYVDTVIMGNPIDRPVIKAASRFANSTLLIGQDPNYSGLVGFYHEIKNLVFDTTAIPSKTITILSWSISQGCQVSNILFNMAPDATGHTGITSSGLNSPLLLNDLQFVGGGVGYSVVATQYHFKNLYFKSMLTNGFAVQSSCRGADNLLRYHYGASIEASCSGHWPRSPF